MPSQSAIFRRDPARFLATMMVKDLKIELPLAQSASVCDVLQQELKDGRRLIAESSDFAAFAPFKSRFPFEVCIMPKRHQSALRLIGESEIENLAVVLQKLDATLGYQAPKPLDSAATEVLQKVLQSRLRVESLRLDLDWVKLEPPPSRSKKSKAALKTQKK